MKLCDSCHERPATCFLTTIVGNVQQATNLCEVCFEKSESPGLSGLMATLKEAHCRYCGGQPCAGGTDILSALTEGTASVSFQTMGLMCMSCSTEHDRYIQQKLMKLKGVSKDQSRLEKLAEVRSLKADVGEHMKQWVAERDKHS